MSHQSWNSQWFIIMMYHAVHIKNWSWFSMWVIDMSHSKDATRVFLSQWLVRKVNDKTWASEGIFQHKCAHVNNCTHGNHPRWSFLQIILALNLFAGAVDGGTLLVQIDDASHAIIVDSTSVPNCRLWQDADFEKQKAKRKCFQLIGSSWFHQLKISSFSLSLLIIGIFRFTSPVLIIDAIIDNDSKCRYRCSQNGKLGNLREIT